MAEAGNGDDLTRFVSLGRRADHDRRHAGHVHLVGMQHRERDAGGAAGIDRIAACLEDGETGGGSEIVAGGDRVTAAVERRAHGFHG
jgi:hypothetical protein